MKREVRDELRRLFAAHGAIITQIEEWDTDRDGEPWSWMITSVFQGHTKTGLLTLRNTDRLPVEAIDREFAAWLLENQKGLDVGRTNF